MNRPTISLLATGSALLALTGLASLSTGDDPDTAADRPAATAPRPVERTVLTCPSPGADESATTTYTAYTPASDDAAGQGEGSAGLLPAPEYVAGTEGESDGDGGDRDAEEPAEPVAPLDEPGVPVTTRTERAGAPALTGTAEQRLAPGWTVQQTTRVDSGTGRGLLGTACQPPDTEFWFAGASTAETRQDYVHIINPDAVATVVDIELYGPEGRLEAEPGQGITVPSGASVPVRLSTLTDEALTDLAVKVTARTGRIGAQIEAVDEELGADWLAPAATGDGRVVLPGIPAGAPNVQLVAYAPGEEDITLEVGLAGPTGTITPAGNETVAVSAGALTTMELSGLTQGEPGSLVLTPAAGSGGGLVIATLRVTEGGDEGEGGNPELAFIPAAVPVEQRASVTGNTTDGTQLTLTAPGAAAEVEITISAGTEGGQPVTESRTVNAGTTLTLTPELPAGTEGHVAITVERTSGGPLHAARILSEGGGEDDDDGGRMFTIQTLADDRSTVAVPETSQDLSILID